MHVAAELFYSLIISPWFHDAFTQERDDFVDRVSFIHLLLFSSKLGVS